MDGIDHLFAAKYETRLFPKMNDTICWDGLTQGRSCSADEAIARHALADAARDAEWTRVFEILTNYRKWWDPTRHGSWVNATRLDGSSWYAPLHQAAWHGAAVAVAERLIGLGAWRTLRNARGERPLDVANRRGNRRLLHVLAPECKHDVPREDLSEIQAHFHAVIRVRAEHLVVEQRLRLPELEPLLELDQPEMWFAVPGMAGGFHYWLRSECDEIQLVSESWCRVVGGSGQRHKITPRGSRLVDEGFV